MFTERIMDCPLRRFKIRSIFCPSAWRWVRTHATENFGLMLPNLGRLGRRSPACLTDMIGLASGLDESRTAPWCIAKKPD